MDLFFRVTANEKSVQWITCKARYLVIDSHTKPPHPLDPIPRPSLQVHAPARQGNEGKRHSRRERTPDDESMDEAEIQEYFDILHFTSPEILTPANFSGSTPIKPTNAPCSRRFSTRRGATVGISPDPRCFPADPRCTEANAKWIKMNPQQAKDAREKFGMFPPERCRSELIRAAGTPKKGKDAGKRSHGDDSADTHEETPTKRRRAAAVPDQPLQLTKNARIYAVYFISICLQWLTQA